MLINLNIRNAIQTLANEMSCNSEVFESVLCGIQVWSVCDHFSCNPSIATTTL